MNSVVVGKSEKYFMGTNTITIERELCRLAREISLSAIKSAAVTSEFQLIEARRDEDAFDRMAFIAVSDWAMKIGFRVMFRFEDAASIFGKHLDRNDQKSKDAIVDYVKEFCNLTGGKLIQMLETKSRPMGISIPIENNAPKGFELERSRYAGRISDRWLISTGRFDLHCMSSVVISNRSALSDLNLSSITAPNEDSDLEFL